VEQDQGFQSQAKSTVEAPAFLQSPEAAVAVGHPGQPAPIVSSAADGRWWRDEERPTTHGALDLPPAVMNTFVGSFCLTRKPELVVRSAADGSVHHDRRRPVSESPNDFRPDQTPMGSGVVSRPKPDDRVP